MILYITQLDFSIGISSLLCEKYSLLKDLLKKIYVYSLYDYELFIEGYKLAKLL